MAKERYSTIGKVLEEFAKYQDSGECQHFWPDENTACKIMMKEEEIY